MIGPLFSSVGAMSCGVGVVLPLRQVMAGPPFSRVGAMSRGAGEGHADISVEEGGGDGAQQVAGGGGTEARVRGSKRGGVAKAGWKGKAEVVLTSFSEESRCEDPGYKQTLPTVGSADHVLPPHWEEMKGDEVRQSDNTYPLTAKVTVQCALMS